MEKENHIVRELLQIGVFLQKMGNKLLEGAGLNQQQFVTLNEIVTQRQVYQKELVGKLLVEKSNLSKIIKKLHHAKLITVKISAEDRRAALLEPTPMGENLCINCLDILSSWNEKWLKDLSNEDKEQSLEILRKLGKFTR